MTYYNTVGVAGSELREYVVVSEDQDCLIYDIFLIRPGQFLSSHEVEELLGGKILRSSVVRSMNSLTKQGKIEKTHIKKVGKYGRPVYTWKLYVQGQPSLI